MKTKKERTKQRNKKRREQKTKQKKTEHAKKTHEKKQKKRGANHPKKQAGCQEHSRKIRRQNKKTHPSPIQ